MTDAQALNILNTGLLKALENQAKEDAKVLAILDAGLLEALEDREALKILDDGLLKALTENKAEAERKAKQQRFVEAEMRKGSSRREALEAYTQLVVFGRKSK